MAIEMKDIANAINSTRVNEYRYTRVELEQEIDRLKMIQSSLNEHLPIAKTNILKALNYGNRPSVIMRIACKALGDISGEKHFFHQIALITSALFDSNDETDAEKIKRLEKEIELLKRSPWKSCIDMKIIQNAVNGRKEEINRIKL